MSYPLGYQPPAPPDELVTASRLDWSRKPTLSEWLETDARLDSLFRGVWEAFQDGYRGVRERRDALKAAKDEAAKQISKRTG